MFAPWIIYGGLGLIAGSFLNVMVLRRGTGKTLGGRSACFSCGAPILWYDLLPVVSYVILSGRCRHCGSRISIQYPLVEAASALLFIVIGLSPLPLSGLVLALPITMVFVAIAAYDLRHTIIPDSWALLFAMLAAALSLLGLPPDASWQEATLVLAGGPLAATPLAALWALSRGAWMGLGDVKLAIGIGFLLGPMLGFIAVMGAFVIGAAISLAVLLPLPYWWIVFCRLFGIQPLSTPAARLTMKSEVPFGPFLILSTCALWIIALYGIELPIF